MENLTPTNKLTQLRNEDKRQPVVLLSCGSFSPVTLMHIEMLERARSALIADGKVVLGGYLSPVHDKYGKQGLASFSSRLRMLELATANSPWLMVDAWEANQADASSTYTVVKHLSSVVPNATIVLVCGADLVHSMQDPSRWIPKNVHELLDCATLCVLYRQGSPPPPNTLSDRNGVARPLIHVDAPFLHGSSTDVRKLVAEGKCIEHLVHSQVARYVKEENLFTPSSYQSANVTL